jgi:hypothetical protein
MHFCSIEKILFLLSFCGSVLPTAFTYENLARYPQVSIINSTNKTLHGKVEYYKSLCPDDEFLVEPNERWEGSFPRGNCLVTQISTVVGENHVEAKAYISPGTIYSEFAIMDLNDRREKYEVTRLVADTPEPQQEGETETNLSFSPLFYDAVGIVNSSDQSVSGFVTYAACKSDQYTIGPRQNWIGPYRGGCLLTSVSAYVGENHEPAISYNSSGTGYSQFAVIKLNNGSYQVTRRVS